MAYIVFCVLFLFILGGHYIEVRVLVRGFDTDQRILVAMEISCVLKP